LLGYRGYGISPAGLSGRFEAIKQAIEDGWAAARQLTIPAPLGKNAKVAARLLTRTAGPRHGD
jgi:hypothetical protein